MNRRNKESVAHRPSFIFCHLKKYSIVPLLYEAGLRILPSISRLPHRTISYIFYRMEQQASMHCETFPAPEMRANQAEFDVIVAYDQKTRGIGRYGLMPWHLPPDLREFKRRTMGHILILGRKTWDSIGRTPLPGRFHVVITKTPHRYWSSTQSPYVAFVSCFENALTYATMLRERIGPFFRKQVFVAGGEQVYRDALAHYKCRFVFATEIQLNMRPEATFDAFFPQIEHRDHVRVSCSDWMVSKRYWYRFTCIGLIKGNL